MKKIYKKMLSLFIAVLFVVGLSIPVFADSEHTGSGTHFGRPEFYKSSYLYNEEFSCTGAEDFFASHPAPVCDYTTRTGEYDGFADMLVDAGNSYDDLGYFSLVYYRSDTRFQLYQFAFTAKDCVKDIVFNSTDNKIYFNFVDGFDDTIFYVESTVSFTSSSYGKFKYSGGSFSYAIIDYIPGVQNHCPTYWDLSSNVVGITSSHDVYTQNGDLIVEKTKSAFEVEDNPEMSVGMSPQVEIVGKRENWIEDVTWQNLTVEMPYLGSDEYGVVLPIISTSKAGFTKNFENAVFCPIQKTNYLRYILDDTYLDKDSDRFLGTDFEALFNSITWNVLKAKGFLPFSQFYPVMGDWADSNVFKVYDVYGATPFYFVEKGKSTVINWQWENVKMQPGVTYYVHLYYFTDKYITDFDSSVSNFAAPLIGSWQGFLENGSDLFTLGWSKEFSLKNIPDYVPQLEPGTKNYVEYALDLSPDSGVEIDMRSGKKTNNTVDSEWWSDNVGSGGFIESGSSSNGGLSFDITSLDSLFNSCKDFFSFLKHGFSIFPNWIWYLIASVIVVLIFLRIMGR